MRVNRTWMIGWLLSMMMLLSGCQLAKKEDQVAAKTKDEFVGVYITLEPLYEVTKVEEANLKVEAVAKEIVEDGITTTTFVFEGIDGIPFFHATVKEEEGSYRTTIQEETVADVYVNFHTIDDTKRETTLEGTVYYTTEDDLIFYSNMVYQTAEGTVYMIPGEGVASGISMMTVAETSTVTENGVTKELETKVTMNYKSMLKGEEYTVKQFDAQDHVIDAIQFTYQNAPKSIVKHQDTVYIIVEKVGMEEENQTVVSRTLLEEEAEGVSCQRVLENGIAQTYYIELVEN